MTQQHETRLPQCEQQFVQTSHDVSQMMRAAERIALSVADLKTSAALMHDSQETFKRTVTDSQVASDKRCADEMCAQETRVQLSISRLWRVVFVILGGVGIGGGSVAIERIF